MYNLVTIADNTKEKNTSGSLLSKTPRFFDTGEIWQA